MNVLAYPAKAGRNPDVLRAINEGNYTLDGLRKQFGISPAVLKRDYGAKSNGRGRPKQPKPFSEPKKAGQASESGAGAITRGIRSIFCADATEKGSATRT